MHICSQHRRKWRDDRVAALALHKDAMRAKEMGAPQ
jgi:hypothetical protein